MIKSKLMVYECCSQNDRGQIFFFCMLMMQEITCATKARTGIPVPNTNVLKFVSGFKISGVGFCSTSKKQAEVALHNLHGVFLVVQWRFTEVVERYNVDLQKRVFFPIVSL